MLSAQTVAEHASQDNCWIIIHGQVYDITSFIPGGCISGPSCAISDLFNRLEHPGGSKIILKYAGKDATYGSRPLVGEVDF